MGKVFKLPKLISSNKLQAFLIGSSLSASGSTISLIALSTILFGNYPSGVYSSLLNSSIFISIALMGVIGGKLLDNFKPAQIGIFVPFLSGTIILPLLFINDFTPFICFSVVFLIFLLEGINHPNNIRVINRNVQHTKKPQFFSLYQSFSQFMSILSPALAGGAILYVDIKVCFFLDIVLYGISLTCWLHIKDKILCDDNEDHKKKDLFAGYKILLNNKNIRFLTISRFLNNLSYITFIAAMPIFISRSDNVNELHFAKLLTTAQVTMGIACVVSGLLGTYILKNEPRMLKYFIYLTSLCGFSSVSILGFCSTETMLIVASFIIGIGQYCFKISGMVLGTTITPGNILGNVIISGDTVIRGCSFLIGISTPFAFSTVLYGGIPFFLLSCSLTLVSPFLLLESFNIYLGKIKNPKKYVN